MPQEKTQKCVRCFVILTHENKAKKRRLCFSCNKLVCKEYRQKNKQAISEYNQKYKKIHRDEISQYNHDYNILNRQAIQQRHTVYLRERRKSNVNYKISITCRNKIKKLIKHKYRSSELIGCSTNLLLEWLKSNFTEGMTFENHGTFWHIDHVIPCIKFNMTNIDDTKKCFNWVNLQPLKAKANLSKKDKILIDDIKMHWCKVTQFMQNKKIKAEYFFSDYEPYITTSTTQVVEGTRLIAVPNGKKI